MLGKAGYKVVPVHKGADLSVYTRLYGDESVRYKRFYNIGAGSFSHPYWTNIDHKSGWYSVHQKNVAFLEFDILSREPISLDNNKAEIVYTSHTIEHIDDESAQYLFQEVNRILKDGGVFRVTVPDVDLHYRAYKNNDRDYFYWKEHYKQPKHYKKVFLKKPLSDASIQQLFLYEIATHVSDIFSDSINESLSDKDVDAIFNSMNYKDALNYIVSKCSFEKQNKYPGNHINWWNKNKVIEFLEKAGFKNINISGYGQSCAEVLRDLEYFDNTHPKISLYVEAEAVSYN